MHFSREEEEEEEKKGRDGGGDGVSICVILILFICRNMFNFIHDRRCYYPRRGYYQHRLPPRRGVSIYTSLFNGEGHLAIASMHSSRPYPRPHLLLLLLPSPALYS